MTLTRESDQDVYCYLKRALEPTYRVIAEPHDGYYAQWRFCYRIFHREKLLAEFQGDFRELPAGSLFLQAQAVVAELSVGLSASSSCRRTDAPLPIASRLPPKRDSRTWFSSGRAAFAWLIGNEVRPASVILPTFVCWSLIDVMLQRFPDIPVSFYPVRRDLQCDYPASVDPAHALVDIHYFGHRSRLSAEGPGGTVLEDCSHCLTEDRGCETEVVAPDGKIPRYRFGSLRKTFRVADGGYIQGRFLPSYEPDDHLDAWLRLNAADWRDLREAENMMDRNFRVSDISSQSLSVILSTDASAAAQQRRANNAFLTANFRGGDALVDFAEHECPLLHGRWFQSREERDSLRDYLTSRQVFTSIHWPVHEYLLSRRDEFDIEDALWLDHHSLALPIAEDFANEQMEMICSAARDWISAGGSRFPYLAAG